MKPQVLVLHYDHNDPDPIGNEYLPDYIAPEVGENFLHSALVKWVVRRITYTRNKNRIFVKGEHETFQEYIIKGPAYDRHLEALRQLSLLSRENKIPVFIVIFDTWMKYSPDRLKDRHYQILHKKLRSFLLEDGFRVLDLYDVFQDYMKQNHLSDLKALWVGPRDGHPNRKGHTIIAESLYQKMMEDSRFRELLDGYKLEHTP